jgi:hypothetical protein
LPMVLQTEFARQKKKRFPLEIYRRIFIPSVILWLTDGKYPSVNPSVSIWNKSVGECMKYRRNISVCKFIGTVGSYC